MASGEYASASEVVRAGLKALEREHNARTEWIRIKVEEALSDTRPGFLAEDVFARLEQQIRTRGAVSAPAQQSMSGSVMPQLSPPLSRMPI